MPTRRAGTHGALSIILSLVGVWNSYYFVLVSGDGGCIFIYIYIHWKLNSGRIRAMLYHNTTVMQYDVFCSAKLSYSSSSAVEVRRFMRYTQIHKARNTSFFFEFVIKNLLAKSSRLIYAPHNLLFPPNTARPCRTLQLSNINALPGTSCSQYSLSRRLRTSFQYLIAS